jgi:cellulose synthase/poly-beta-1,6-N-acetylglucosamine synthase-like glycosyltransferase
MRLVIEAAVIAAVAVLSLRRGVFLIAALLRPRSLPRPAAHPAVTVLVPARNERVVAERLLRALARLEYPADKLSFVLVCDGCADETPTLFRAWAHGRSDTLVIELPQRVGKAAALNAGLRLAKAGLVAVVDADLEPQPDFLLELVRPFADDRVAGAAAFLRPANADDNVITRYAAVTTWVHQLVTSAGTDRLGLNPPTLGASAFRRTMLEEIGGFPAVPSGEDVATSSRLTRMGWRTRFVAAAVADNTVVSDVRDYWRQHIRWSRAVFRVNTSKQPSTATFMQRVETAASSTGNADRLVFAAATGGAVVGLLPVWVPLLYLTLPGLEIVAALLKAGVRHRLPWFLVATVLFFAADLVGSVAAVIIHVARRPHRWQSPRWSHVDGDAKQ